MRDKRPTTAQPWEKVKSDDVPLDIQTFVLILLEAAIEQGCDCDPEVSVPSSLGAVTHALVAHEDTCGIWQAEQPSRPADRLTT